MIDMCNKSSACLTLIYYKDADNCFGPFCTTRLHCCLLIPSTKAHPFVRQYFYGLPQVKCSQLTYLWRTGNLCWRNGYKDGILSRQVYAAHPIPNTGATTGETTSDQLHLMCRTSTKKLWLITKSFQLGQSLAQWILKCGPCWYPESNERRGGVVLWRLPDLSSD